MASAETLALELCDIVREELSYREITIGEFAKKMDVSLATMNRWLNGQGVTLTDWSRMLEKLGLHISDAVARVSERTFGQFEYTKEQEDAFVRTEGLLAFFNEMISGKEVKDIMKEHGLNSHEAAFYLRRLDDLGLVAWSGMSIGNIKPKYFKAEPKWRTGGSLAKAFKQKAIDELVALGKKQEGHNRSAVRLGLYQLLPEDAERLKTSINELYATARECEQRARLSRRDKATYGILNIFEEFAPRFLTEIPKPKLKARP